MAITRNDRAFGVSKYGIELQHTMAGFVKEVSGGDAVADVVAEKLGSDHLTKKHLGPLKYEEVNFKCGTGMSSQLYEWIKTGFNQTSHSRGREDGAILFADMDNTEVSRLTWTHGLISEFGMPALDASSKDSAMMTLKFHPETTRKTWGGGGKLSFPADAAKQKKWLPSNFRLRIDGCENGCVKVNKIEALTIKQKITENAIGEQRDYQKEPTSVEIPNLVITLAESHADDFYRWHENFVIKGNNGETEEKGYARVPHPEPAGSAVHPALLPPGRLQGRAGQGRGFGRADPPPEGRDVLRRHPVQLQPRRDLRQPLVRCQGISA